MVFMRRCGKRKPPDTLTIDIIWSTMMSKTRVNIGHFNELTISVNSHQRGSVNLMASFPRKSSTTSMVLSIVF